MKAIIFLSIKLPVSITTAYSKNDKVFMYSNASKFS